MKPITQFHYYIFNKPYRVLCQFSPASGKSTLLDFGPFPRHVYPVGRLDYDSEGLVLLTDDGLMQHALLEPKFHHPRTYLAQVERIPGTDALRKFCDGIIIEKKRTRPALVQLLLAEPALPPRPVPIRFRKSVPTAWIELTIYEGKNRQVRKMTAAVGHPTLRLVRIRIGTISIEGLLPGEHRELSGAEVEELRTRVRTAD